MMEVNYAASPKVRQLVALLIERAGDMEMGKRYTVSVASLICLFAGNMDTLKDAVHSAKAELISVRTEEAFITFQALEEYTMTDVAVSFVFSPLMVKFCASSPRRVADLLAHHEPTLH